MTEQWRYNTGSEARRKPILETTHPKLDQKRWSTYTADTSITALESGSDDSFARLHKEEENQDNSFDSVEQKSRSRSSSPAGDTMEDTINAALTSMLSTANDLLMSTIRARSDLARLQRLEDTLDAELDRREERILGEIHNNEKMSQWIDKASIKLDRILMESSINRRGAMKRAPSIMNAWTHQEAGPSDLNARHWRSTSTTAQSNTLHDNLSLGLLEAKDENATLSKTAAKRLEKMLQRANSNSNIDPNKTLTKDIKASDYLVPISPAERKEDGLLSPTIGMSAASSSTIIPLAPSSHADTSTSASTESNSNETDRVRSPSITAESGSSSFISSRDEDVKAATSDINEGEIDPQALLTPPTPFEELTPIEELKNGLSKRSLSSLRSPSSAVKSSGHASSGSYVSEAALGQMILDENGNASTSIYQGTTHNKGALEALRKLNKGSSFVNHASQSSTSSGWSGSFASWVGITSPTPSSK